MAEEKGGSSKSTLAGNSNLFNKGMTKDVTDIFITEGLWTHAVNAINNSHYGESGSIGNEPSNKLCAAAPYTIIGFAHMPDTKKWVIFSTNNVQSEIGIFDQALCTYVKSGNNKCLGFKITHLITAVVKKNTDCSYSAYWQDNLNPDRTINFDKIPYVCHPVSDDPCDGEECTDQIDCEKLRLQPAVKQPCVTIQKAKGGGQVNNGSYSAVIAYSENGIRLTDYSMPSTPQGVWRNEGQGHSLEVTVEDLDPAYDEYELVIISVITQQAIAKKIGFYSTSQNKVVVDIIQGAMETVPLVNIPLRSIVYDRSEKMVDINGYLIRMAVSTMPYFNYQHHANKIQTEWVAASFPVNYYWNGGNLTGYYRDEVYSFFIRWVYLTGNRSASYHIPGRPALASDLAPVSGSDAIYANETQRWQVYDTSTFQTASGTTPDEGVITARGKMGYHQSTEKYPVDTEVWGPLCNQPIRHHKMPSNETIHIHAQGGETISVLGVQFTNIEHPTDSSGNPIKEVVGYEILRGSREGNRSIVAKGIFANMMEFDIKGNGSVKGLMQNYPYNDLRPDPFLTNDHTHIDGSINKNTADESPRLSVIKGEYLSFHSPETNFIRPSLGGNHIKLYNTVHGRARGKFEIPYKHPKFKLLSNGALVISYLVGLGIAIVNALGKTTVGPSGTTNTIGVTLPVTELIGTTSMASREGGPATAITDLLAGTTISTTAAAGIITGTAALQTVSVVAGALNLIAGFAFYMPQAMNQVFEIIYNLASYRDYYLQYNSYGRYHNHIPIVNASIPNGVKPSVRRSISTDGAKYIGSGVQDFNSSYRINNLMRTKYVCLKLDATVPNPYIVDDSKRRIKDVQVNTANTHKNPTISEFPTTISSHYGAIKADYQNQYGQLESVVQLPTGSCTYNSKPVIGLTNSTGVIFGGDIYINRYTEKNPYFFFNSWLVDSIDGTEYDYTQYVNGPIPRYYAIFNKYDISDLKLQLDWNFPSAPSLMSTPPGSLYKLDEKSSFLGNGRLIRKHAWAYLFYNGVRDYFTESELNMAYRDYGESPQEKFYDIYGNSFNDVNTMFRSDLISQATYYKYDMSLSASRLYYNMTQWGSILPRDYNPSLYETCYQYLPNRVVYSLQHKTGLKRDNWRNYLPFNYKDFNAKPSVIKTLNAQGAVILFEDSEPVQFTGVDQLQTTGSSKITIGDGGLFSQNYQGLVNADDAMSYGSCKASRSAVNTPFGLFWVSQDLGKIMHFEGAVDEISRNGMKYWFAEHLPSQLLKQYPDYPLYDNPVAGIGCQAIYDPTYELLYFTKKDYVALRDDLKFDDPNGIPYYNCGSVSPGDDRTVVPESDSEGELPSCTLTSNLVNVTVGDTVVLTWTTQNAESVTANGNSGSLPLNGTLTLTVMDNVTYYIEAIAKDGSKSVCSIKITANSRTTKCPCEYDDPSCFEKCDWTVSYDPKSKQWISFHDWKPNLMMPSYQNFYTTDGNKLWKHNNRWDSYANYYDTDYFWEVEYPIVTPNSVTVLKNLEYTLDVYKFYNDGRDFFHVLDENFDRAIIHNSEQISGLLSLKIKGKNSPLDSIKPATFNGTSLEILFSKEENKFRFNQFWDITNDRGEFTGSQAPMWITRCSGYEREINPTYVDYSKTQLNRKKFRHYGNKIVLRKNRSNDKKMILKLANSKNTQSPR